jgi:single-stranded-DNA-specific exonuclease
MALEKRWKLPAENAAKTDLLQKALTIHPVLCSILVQRGIETL